MTFFRLFTVLFFVFSLSCQKSDDRATAPNNTSAKAIGTSDSGGGTGIGNKIFESYRIDPSEEPGYKQFIEPLLKNILRGGESTHYEFFFKTKSWYVAPVDLEPIEKDLLGVTFLKSKTQQIARQSLHAVWIDQKIYNQMLIREQGELILHELVMSLYFLKFLKMSEICSFSALVPGVATSSCPQKDLLDKTAPPEDFHPLNAKDNENIRFVTEWILQNAQRKISEKDLNAILLNKDFDKRLFSSKNTQPMSNLENIKISGKELFQAIKGGQFSGNLPQLCRYFNSEKLETCRIEISEKTIKPLGTEIKGYNLNLTTKDSRNISVLFFIHNEATLQAIGNDEGGITYSFAVADWREKIQIGDRVYSGFLFFKKPDPSSQSSLILDSVLLKPGVVTSIDKSREPVCLVQSPQGSSDADQGVLAQTQKGKMAYFLHAFAATSPYVACSNANVQ